MTEQVTLRKLAILHARNKVSDDFVKQGLSRVGKVTEKREDGETWFEGNPENTIASVQALIGVEITQEDFDDFVRLLD